MMRKGEIDSGGREKTLMKARSGGGGGARNLAEAARLRVREAQALAAALRAESRLPQAQVSP